MKILQQIIIIIIVFTAGWFVGSGGILPINSGAGNSTDATCALLSSDEDGNVSIMIDDGMSISTMSDVPMIATSTVFDVLRIVSEDKSIDLKYKDYGGELGMFIETIDGLPEEGSKDMWWQYWVNNEYGVIGASNMTVSAGDIILWKLTGNQQETSP